MNWALLVSVLAILALTGSAACARMTALRAAPQGDRRFTCVDANREQGVRVLVLNHDEYAVYRRGNREAQIAYRDVLTVSIIKSHGLVLKRNLRGLAVQSRDGRTAFYVVNGYVGLIGHSRRAQQAAIVMREQSAANRPLT